MAARYFSSAPISTSTVTLDGPEAHHLLHVMRAGPGTEIVLFDGSGAEFEARIRETKRSDVVVEIHARREVDREAKVALTLGVALPKGDRQRWLVEKATELGVARLVPLVTQRGVAQPEANTREKLRRAVIEASKQCGRNRLMAIDEPAPLGTFLRRAPETDARLFAHTSTLPSASSKLPSGSTSVVAAIGPEGGFTDEEAADAIAAGWTPVSLGPRILRVETAALALAAALILER